MDLCWPKLKNLLPLGMEIHLYTSEVGVGNFCSLSFSLSSFNFFIYFFMFYNYLISDKTRTHQISPLPITLSCSLFGYKRNLKALFCLVIPDHQPISEHHFSFFSVYCTHKFWLSLSTDFHLPLTHYSIALHIP